MQCELLRHIVARQNLWKTALGILAYIKGTSGYGITCPRGSLARVSLKVLAHADYATETTDRRSVSGGVIMSGGVCVCWFSRTQKCVTLSTTEAEYANLGDAEKEILFLRQV